MYVPRLAFRRRIRSANSPFDSGEFGFFLDERGAVLRENDSFDTPVVDEAQGDHHHQRRIGLSQRVQEQRLLVRRLVYKTSATSLHVHAGRNLSYESGEDREFSNRFRLRADDPPRPLRSCLMSRRPFVVGRSRRQVPQ